MKNKLIFILLFCASTYQVAGQKNDSLISNYLALGLGVPQWNVRDNVSSSLAYKGIGLGEFSLSKMKIKSNCIKHFSLTIGLGGVRPNIKNKTDWNTSAEIYSYDIGYSYLKPINTENKVTRFYFGGKVSTNAKVFIYPVINNIISYDLNWLSIQPTGMITHDFKLKKVKSRLIYQFSIPILAFNSRPKSYIGLFPSEDVWSQDSEIGSSLFSDILPTSIHDNLNLESTLCWDVYTKKNKLRLTYNWLYAYNKTAVNSLVSVKSSVTLSYLIQLNKKS